ncbi:hypothetical protein F5Y19DRAFT_407044 [Xylariaceae sp. FL1651]|nr:hypothetical protein F5Y19DRAFT_407044 [Xylariaceae sp. FL1651]
MNPIFIAALSLANRFLCIHTVIGLSMWSLDHDTLLLVWGKDVGTGIVSARHVLGRSQFRRCKVFFTMEHIHENRGASSCCLRRIALGI